MKTFASRYKLERRTPKLGHPYWCIYDLIDETELDLPGPHHRRIDLEWPLLAKRTIEAYSAGLTDRDLLDTEFRAMSAHEIKKARGK